MPLPGSHPPLYSFPSAHRRAAIPNDVPPTISKLSAPLYRFDLPLSRRASARFQPSPPCFQTNVQRPQKDNGPEHTAARVGIRELGDDERGEVLQPHAALWYRLLRQVELSSQAPRAPWSQRPPGAVPRTPGGRTRTAQRAVRRTPMPRSPRRQKMRRRPIPRAENRKDTPGLSVAPTGLPCTASLKPPPTRTAQR